MQNTERIGSNLTKEALLILEDIMTYRRNKSVEERKRGWRDALKAIGIAGVLCWLL